MVESGLVRRCEQSPALCPALFRCSEGSGGLDLCEGVTSECGNRDLHVQNGTIGHFLAEFLRIYLETAL